MQFPYIIASYNNQNQSLINQSLSRFAASDLAGGSMVDFYSDVVYHWVRLVGAPYSESPAVYSKTQPQAVSGLGLGFTNQIKLFAAA